MNVLHVWSGNLYGGVERALATFARCRDLCPTMTPSFALSFEGRLSEELRQSGVATHVLGEVRVRNPLSVLRARRSLVRVLSQERFDVAIAHGCWPQAVFGPAIVRSGVPLVLWLHDRPNGRHWIERWAKRTVPVYVIFNSRFTEQARAVLYAEVPGETIYLPIDTSRPASGSRRLRLRRQMGTASEETIVIQAGRMQARKGHIALLDALAQLATDDTWRCWIVGGPQQRGEQHYMESLREHARSLGIAERVTFAGFRDDVTDLMAAADIFCQANLAPETFGLVLVEALHADVPVLTTRLGAAPEIVDATCGVLVAPADTSGLAASLRQLITDKPLRTRLAANGRRRAEVLCDPARQLGMLASRLTTLVEERDKRVAD